MEESLPPNINRTVWFVVGYFSAIGVMFCAEWLSRYLSSLESSGVIVSPNGAAETKRDEEVAKESVALVKEYTEETSE